MKRRRQVTCLLFATFFLFLGFFANPKPTFAYGTDVHFNLTYVLCRLAGIPAKDAIWIADANQSMDDNNSTTAYGESLVQTYIDDVRWRRNGTLWHSFTTIDNLTAAHQAIETRMSELRDRAFNSISTPGNTDRDKKILSLIAMGQYLHFEQDYFAHRQLTVDCLNPEKWTPYGPFKGHALDGHTPDYVGARPGLAGLMIKDSYANIRQFVEKMYGRTLAAKIDGSQLDILILQLAAGYFPKGDLTKLPTTLEAYINAPNFPSQLVDGNRLDILIFQWVLSKLPNGDLMKLPTAQNTYINGAESPSQQTVISCLAIGLKKIGILDEWASNLPIDPEDSKHFHGDRLPYDAPEIRLSEVKIRVEGDLLGNAP